MNVTAFSVTLVLTTVNSDEPFTELYDAPEAANHANVEKTVNYFGMKNIEIFILKYYHLVMIYTWNDIVKREGSTPLAHKSINAKKYKKVSHGIYTDDGGYISELEQLFVRYPRATLTMQSAFEYYNLSDYIPDKYYLATPYNAHRINASKVVQSYINEETMEIGRIKLKTEYGYIYIFDEERMLIELFRLKSKLNLNYFLEVVSSYRILKTMEAISIRKVSEYCKKLPHGERILREIQEMI